MRYSNEALPVIKEQGRPISREEVMELLAKGEQDCEIIAVLSCYCPRLWWPFTAIKSAEEVHVHPEEDRFNNVNSIGFYAIDPSLIKDFAML